MQKLHQLTNNFTLKKHFFISFFTVITSTLFCYFIQTGTQRSTAPFSLKTATLSSISGLIIVYGIYQMTFVLNRFFPWKKHIANRLFMGLTTHFIFAFGVFYSLFFLYDVLIDFTKNFNTTFKYVFINIKIAIIFFILIVLYEVIYFALHSYYSYSKFQIETIKQERKQIELQLKALKSQISPHFLFNSLNIISSLIYKDKKSAKLFIRKLAKMYRYTLESYTSKLVTLEEEIDVVNSYLFLLQTRFGKMFSCTISISKNLLGTKVPPLAIQMLIENAVKHNQLNEGNPLTISINSDTKFISVSNNITVPTTTVTSFNIGLKNINSRYLLINKKGITVTENGFFTVKIPIIR